MNGQQREFNATVKGLGFCVKVLKLFQFISLNLVRHKQRKPNIAVPYSFIIIIAFPSLIRCEEAVVVLAIGLSDNRKLL